MTLKSFRYTIVGKQKPNSSFDALRKGAKVQEQDSTLPCNALPSRRLHFALHQRSLAVYSICCILFAITLAVLFSISQSNQGLVSLDDQFYYSSIGNSKSGTQRTSPVYYAWKYGPTAVFTLFAVFWGQVEYQVKRVMPWRQIASGASTPEEGALMDYISLSSFDALWSSLKKSHFLVSTAVAGTILIKLMIILSTGLFAAANIPLSDEHAALRTLDDFLPNGTGLNSVDDATAIIVNNLYAYGSPLPFGTTKEYAYQRFEATTGSHTSLIAGNVTVFDTDVECESASLNGLDIDGKRHVTLATSSCNMTFPLASDCGSTSQGDYALYTCERFSRCDSDSATEWRFALAVVNISDSDLPLRVDSSFALSCKPQYQLEEATVSLTPESISRNEPHQITPILGAEMHLPEVPVAEFGQAVFKSWSSAWEPLLSNGTTWLNLFSVFPVIAPETNWTKMWRPSDYDPPTVANVFREVHGLISIQVAKKYFMMSAQDEITGTTVSVVPRLFLRGPAFWATEAILLLIAMFSLVLVGQRNSLSLAPTSSSVNSLARALSSPSMMQILSEPEASCLHDPARADPSQTNESRTSAEDQDVSELATESPEDGHPWYRPSILSWGWRAFVGGMPLIVIVILEATYRYSTTHKGISDVSDGAFAHYAWSYIPALVMAIIGISCSGLDFSIRLLAPYHTLRRKPVSAQSVTSEDFLAKVPLHAAASALRTSQLVVFMISAASILAPFLTVVVAGVFSTVKVPQSTPIRLSQLDEFSPANVSELDALSFTPSTMGDPGRGRMTAGFIMTSNLSYPRWTHGVYAFPQVEIAPSTDQNSSSVPNMTDRVLKAQIPAIRARANCTLLPSTIDDSVTSNRTRLEKLIQWYIPNATSPLPVPSNASNPKFQGSSDDDKPWTSDAAGDGYFGYWYTDELRFDDFDYHPDGSYSPSWSALPAAFPRALAAFGTVHANTTSSVTPLYCTPYLARTTLTAQFLLPDFDLDAGSPLLEEEEHVETVFSHDSYMSLQSGDEWSIPASFSALAAAQRADFADFALLVAYGLGGTPVAELVDPQNVDKLVAAIDHAYGLYMAQVLATQRRAFVDDDHDDDDTEQRRPLLDGVLVDPDRLRLRQDEVSTRVLQAVLAAVAACVVAACVVTSAERVVPRCPCSIAGFAGLVEGSEWLAVIRERVGALEGRGEELEEEALEREVMEGLVLSLGWWGEEGKRRFGIDVEGGEVGEG
ncbi:uncharacterized protein BKCO1_37000143 [Diplodia corticola]|uniref:Uncharacterized protein n=1 Tax=Diplodia corticola TaxID=236234 RepID=A0A1J9RWC1_9PEZI|nr:uncharacterized protein BKCO1_37000143 [Diplodia corticola]OJD32671.1 hypothetical protein BKCO1_37000143 [Diplodia corticola]